MTDIFFTTRGCPLSRGFTVSTSKSNSNLTAMVKFHSNCLRGVSIRHQILTPHYFVTFFREVTISLGSHYFLVNDGWRICFSLVYYNRGSYFFGSQYTPLRRSISSPEQVVMTDFKDTKDTCISRGYDREDLIYVKQHSKRFSKKRILVDKEGYPLRKLLGHANE